MNSCLNCNATSNLNDYWPDDQPKAVLLCDDCMEAQQRLEKQADELAALPSCECRQMLIDHAETVQQLVNSLRSHDQQGCMLCRPVERIAAGSEQGNSRKAEVA